MAAPHPPRVTFQALATGVTCRAQYNPETFEEDVQAVYQKIKVQGLSHQVLQFEHTENWTCSFDLAFDALSLSDARGLSADINDTRNWLQSLMYQSRKAVNVATGSPTRVLFVWPGLISLTCVVDSVKMKHKRFAWTGLDMKTTWFIATMKLMEIRDSRLFAEDVAARGTLRTST